MGGLSRHEDRVHRLCHRILGSADAAEDATREALASVRRGDPDFDVVRAAHAACRQAGSEPEREALALRELEGLTFGEIAALLGVDQDTVALQVVWAGAPAATVLASPVCERALPLLAREQDGLLDEESNEAGWLGEHLMHCRGCRLRRDAMQPPGEPHAERPPPVPAPDEPRAPRRRRGEAALAGVLACVFLLVVLFGPASYNEMLGSPFPEAEDEQWTEPADANPAVPRPAGRAPGDSRPARGNRGSRRRGTSGPRGERTRGDRRRRRPARRSNRAQRNRATAPASPPAEKKKEAPAKKRDVARGRVEHQEEQPPQEDLVPEVVTEPAPPPPPETAPPPPPPQ